jgi:hypothetical protein
MRCEALFKLVLAPPGAAASLFSTNHPPRRRGRN